MKGETPMKVSWAKTMIDGLLKMLAAIEKITLGTR